MFNILKLLRRLSLDLTFFSLPNTIFFLALIPAYRANPNNRYNDVSSSGSVSVSSRTASRWEVLHIDCKAHTYMYNYIYTTGTMCVLILPEVEGVYCRYRVAMCVCGGGGALYGGHGSGE